MKKINYILVMMMLFGGLAGTLRAEETVFSAAGQGRGMENSAGSARTKAMGSAFVGLADDSSTILSNPAGLALLDRPEFAMHHNSWLVGTSQETGVIGLPVLSSGGLGFSLSYIDYGTFDTRDNNGWLIGKFDANDLSIGVGWGQTLIENILGGITLKGSQLSLANETYPSYAGDIGFLYMLSNSARLGLAYTNIGTGVAGSKLNSALKVGGSWVMDWGSQDRLTLVSDLSLASNNVKSLRVGGEGILFSMLALRGGYQFSFADTSLHGLNGLSAGMGLCIKKTFLFDYAYLPFGDLGDSHRLSITYRFSSVSSRQTEE